METWQQKEMITQLEETLHGKQLQLNSELTDDEIAEQVRLLTGRLLTLCSFIALFATLADVAVQSSLVTPVTAVLLLSGYSEMESHIRSLSDQLRILISSLPTWPSGGLNKEEAAALVYHVTQLLDDCSQSFEFF